MTEILESGNENPVIPMNTLAGTILHQVIQIDGIEVAVYAAKSQYKVLICPSDPSNAIEVRNQVNRVIAQEGRLYGQDSLELSTPKHPLSEDRIPGDLRLNEYSQDVGSIETQIIYQPNLADLNIVVGRAKQLGLNEFFVTPGLTEESKSISSLEKWKRLQRNAMLRTVGIGIAGFLIGAGLSASQSGGMLVQDPFIGLLTSVPSAFVGRIVDKSHLHMPRYYLPDLDEERKKTRKRKQRVVEQEPEGTIVIDIKEDRQLTDEEIIRAALGKDTQLKNSG